MSNTFTFFSTTKLLYITKFRSFLDENFRNMSTTLMEGDRKLNSIFY